jgi:transaldolase/glucose-6-phosphate isomerase
MPYNPFSIFSAGDLSKWPPKLFRFADRSLAGTDLRSAIHRLEACQTSGAHEPETSVAETANFAFAGSERSSEVPAELLWLHFAGLKAGDYAGLLPYVERDEVYSAQVATMRTAVRDAKAVATVAGFGPRFLHSTGQAYKGGPATGEFLTIARDPDPDRAVPSRKASFGTVQVAQARGDIKDARRARAPRVRVHLKAGDGGKYALEAAVLAAVKS